MESKIKLGSLKYKHKRKYYSALIICVLNNNITQIIFLYLQTVIANTRGKQHLLIARDPNDAQLIPFESFELLVM